MTTYLDKFFGTTQESIDRLYFIC